MVKYHYCKKCRRIIPIKSTFTHLKLSDEQLPTGILLLIKLGFLK